MGEIIRVSSVRELDARIAGDLKALDRRVKRALAATAREGTSIIRRNVPYAFGDISSSVHADLSKWYAGRVRNVVDDPGAAAVEVGSRPHTPPLDEIVRWVKLRGKQAISGNKLKGPTSALHSARIGAQIRAMRVHSDADHRAIARSARVAYRRTFLATGGGAHAHAAGLEAASTARFKSLERAYRRRGYTPVDVPRQIARAIQAGIAKHGTKPSWYVRSSLPAIREAMHRFVTAGVHSSE